MFIQFFVILCLKIFVMVSDVHKPNRLTNFVHKWVYVDVRVCVHVHMHAGNTMVLEGGKMKSSMLYDICDISFLADISNHDFYVQI